MFKLCKLLAAVCASMAFSSISFSFAPHEHESFSGGKDLYGISLQEKIMRHSEVSLKSSFFAGELIGELENAKVRINQNSNSALVIDLDNTKTFPLDIHTSKIVHCRDFLERNAEKIFPDPSQTKIELSIPSKFESSDFSTISYNIRLNNIKVEDAHIDCRYKGPKLVQIYGKVFGKLNVKDPEKLGYVFSKLNDDQYKGDSYRVYVEKGKYFYLPVESYEITRDGEKYRLQVSKISRRAYEIRKLTFYHDASPLLKTDFRIKIKGSAYERYYADEAVDVTLGNFRVLDGEDSSDVKFTDVFGNVDISHAPFVDSLYGKFVNTYPSTGVYPEFEYDNNAREGRLLKSGNHDSNDLAMAHTNVYYHVNKIVDYTKKFVKTNWLNESLKANINLFRNCNAHWDGTTINFYTGGNGCANTGLISDVVYHEWGHGLDAKTGGIQDGAFSEGFGDIMSIMMTGSPVLGVGFKLDGTPVRHLEKDRIYPDDVTGQVHQDGLIIGSTFWDLYEALLKKYGTDKGRQLFSKFALNAVFAARTYNDVYDALLVIDDNDSNLLNGTPNLCLLNRIFGAHGLADATSECVIADNMRLIDKNGDEVNHFLPGQSYTLALNLERKAQSKVYGVKARLTATLSELSDFFEVVNLGSIEGNSVLKESSPFSLYIPQNTQCGKKFKIVAELVSSQSPDSNNELSVNTVIGKRVSKNIMQEHLGLDLPIPDFSIAEYKFNVEGDSINSDTGFESGSVEFEVSHTYMADVEIGLRAPSGQSVILFKGKYTDGKQKVIKVSDLKKLFDSAMGEVTIKGEWTLTMRDRVRRDEGTFHWFKMNLEPSIYECSN